MPMKWAKHIAMMNLYEQEQKATTPDTIMVTDKTPMVGKAPQTVMVADKTVMVEKTMQKLQEQLNKVCHLGTALAMYLCVYICV